MGEIIPMKSTLSGAHSSAVRVLEQTIHSGNGWQQIENNNKWYVSFHRKWRQYHALHDGVVSKTQLRQKALQIQQIKLFDVVQERPVFSPYQFNLHRDKIVSLITTPKEMRTRHLRCGCTHREWDFADVWVIPSHLSHTETRHHFLFAAVPTPNSNRALSSTVKLIDQWLTSRGNHDGWYAEDSHEVRRARLMAIQVIATYRRNYLKRHGSPPFPELLTRGQLYGR